MSTETLSFIKLLIELVISVSAVGGIVIAVVKWVLKQGKQDDDIKQIKKENALLVSGLCACLDGLEQLGANHTVPKARKEIETYLNETAHGLGG